VKREKYPVCGSSVGENALLMLEVRGEWMSYNSRRPHRVPLISTTNRKKRLQFGRAHHNWTDEDWKNGKMKTGKISWHTLAPLVPIGHRLNATAYLSIVSDHVHPFLATMYPSSG